MKKRPDISKLLMELGLLKDKMFAGLNEQEENVLTLIPAKNA